MLKFFWLVLAIAIVPSSQASEFLFKIKRESGGSACKVLKLQGKLWISADREFVNSNGTLYSGDQFPNHPNYVYFKKDGSSFIVLSSCMQKVTEAPAKAEVARPKSVPKKSSFYAFISYISWQEILLLSGPSSTTYNLISTERGICVGGDWRKQLSTTLEYDISGCGVFTTSDLGLPLTSTAPPVSYSVNSARVWGVDAEIGLGFKLSGTHVTFGPRLGLIYRSGNWSQPPADSGYTLPSTSGLYPTFLLDSKYDLGRFYVQPTLGFFSSISNLLWSLSVGCRI